VERPIVSIIDDDCTFLFHLTRVLCDAGYPVLTARDEGTGLELVREEGADFVILDAWPDSVLSAVRLVDVIRQDQTTSRLPIIVCSPDDRYLEAHGSYLRRHGCLLVGRPFDPERILSLVERATVSHVLGGVPAEVPHHP
jgi:DNA-binding response OmpR family regulator